MGSPSTKVPVVLLPLFIACGGQGDAAFWGFQHASVTVSGDDLEGYQIWELYAERWQRKQKEKHHICSLVQTLTGTATEPVLEGCLDCEAVYAVSVDFLETDCDEDIASRADLAGMTRLAIGAVSDELEVDSPQPGVSLGWYQSFDNTTATPHGYAWQDPEPVEAVWTDGTYTLWPAYAWEL